MEDEYHKKFIIETIPKLDKKCQFFAVAISTALTLSPLVISLIVWYNYDFWVAIGIGLFAYIVTGVVGSKLRLSSIPLDQIEVSHSNLEIATWYVAKYICFVAPPQRR